MHEVTKSNKRFKKKLLVLGVTSSLSMKILSSLKVQNFEIFATHRSTEFIPQIVDINYIHLDISKVESILFFLESIKNYKFTEVLSFIGAESNLNKFPMTNLNKIDSYVKTYVTNLTYLIDNLFIQDRLSKKSKIFILSSRAARFGSQDRYYSISKSALEGYVKSVAKIIDSSISINAISMGLIQDSKMYYRMPKDVILNHKKRSDQKLLSLDTFSDLIVDLVKSDSLVSGKIIYLGPQYE